MIVRLQTIQTSLQTSPALRALVAFFALFLILWQYGKAQFYRDPVSVFFDPRRAFEPLYSAERRRETDSFLKDARLTSNNPHTGDVKGDAATAQICASFLTSGRQVPEQYIDAALGSFLADLTPNERAAVHIQVLFADQNPPVQHNSFNQRWLHEVVDHSYTYDVLDPADRNYAISLAQTQLSNAKVIFDYSLALSHCLSTTNAKYVAIFEDDILFARGWLAQTLLALQTSEEMMKEPGRQEPVPGVVTVGQPNTFLYLRLFNQERSMGWGGGAGFFSNNVHWISLCVDVVLYVIMTWLRQTSPPARRHIDGWTIVVICCVAVPSLVWLFYAAGKASLFPPQPGVREEFFGCCSQALVFKRDYLPNLISFLQLKVREDPEPRCDMLTRDFAYVWGLARLSSYPMMVQHVGSVSATFTEAREAQSITSMAFEYLNGEKLRRSHVDMVQKLFGKS